MSQNLIFCFAGHPQSEVKEITLKIILWPVYPVLGYYEKTAPECVTKSLVFSLLWDFQIQCSRVLHCYNLQYFLKGYHSRHYHRRRHRRKRRQHHPVKSNFLLKGSSVKFSHRSPSLYTRTQTNRLM